MTDPSDDILLADEFIRRWTNAEYLALEKIRTTDNGHMSKTWDIAIMAGAAIHLTAQKTVSLKSDLVSAGILTQARADQIFSIQG